MLDNYNNLVKAHQDAVRTLEASGLHKDDIDSQTLGLTANQLFLAGKLRDTDIAISTAAFADHLDKEGFTLGLAADDQKIILEQQKAELGQRLAQQQLSLKNQYTDENDPL